MWLPYWMFMKMIWFLLDVPENGMISHSTIIFPETAFFSLFHYYKIQQWSLKKIELCLMKANDTGCNVKVIPYWKTQVDWNLRAYHFPPNNGSWKSWKITQVFMKNRGHKIMQIWLGSYNFTVQFYSMK